MRDGTDEEELETQRVMKMMKIDLEICRIHPQKLSLNRGKIISETHFCEKNTPWCHQLWSDKNIHKVLFSQIGSSLRSFLFPTQALHEAKI